MTKILSATETAKILRMRLDVVLKCLDAGEIEAFREGKNWKIPEYALEKYIVERASKETNERKGR